MKNIIASIVAAAGIASMASAQITQMDVETSLDGVSWSGGNRAVNPGTTVQFRYKVSFNANGTTATPTGFAVSPLAASGALVGEAAGVCSPHAARSNPGRLTIAPACPRRANRMRRVVM